MASWYQKSLRLAHERERAALGVAPRLVRDCESRLIFGLVVPVRKNPNRTSAFAQPSLKLWPASKATADRTGLRLISFGAHFGTAQCRLRRSPKHCPAAVSEKLPKNPEERRLELSCLPRVHRGGAPTANFFPCPTYRNASFTSAMILLTSARLVGSSGRNVPVGFPSASVSP